MIRMVVRYLVVVVVVVVVLSLHIVGLGFSLKVS
jgi:hypothetical protein